MNAVQEAGAAVKGRAALSGGGKLAAALAAVTVAAGVAAGALWLAGRQDAGLELADNATVGILPGVDLEQRRTELQNELDESMIAFSINMSPVFADGGAQGNLMIENPGQNAKLLVAELYLTDTDECIYRSKAIQPGTYIENAKLDKRLEKGVYDVTAYLKAYREDTQEFIGQTGAAISLTVQA